MHTVSEQQRGGRSRGHHSPWGIDLVHHRLCPPGTLLNTYLVLETLLNTYLVGETYVLYLTPTYLVGETLLNTYLVTLLAYTS